MVTPAGVPVATPAPMPSQEDVKKGNILPPGGVAFSDFEQMTDDEKADVITAAMAAGVPMFLENSAMQHFAYFTGMSDKPTVVSDAALDKMAGEDIFRTVNNAYNSQIDVGYTSGDIAKQIMYGDYTMYSDSGGSAYGKAIYFANNYRESALYGNNSSAMTMRAKVTGKTISTSQLQLDYRHALMRGDKLAHAVSVSGGDKNLFALAKGYDVVTDASSGYRMVLNRRGITCSSTVKPTNYSGGKW